MAKSKYESHVLPKLKLVEAWARDGLTLDQIARNLNIAEKTLYDYKNRYSEFSQSLKRGKDDADVEVENALYKRALGYRYDEITYENGEEVKRVTKEVHPDVTAQIFWLKNRRPEAWRDRREAPVEEKDKGNIEQLTDALKMSFEQLRGE